MVIAEVLAHRRPGIDQTACLPGQDQSLTGVLKGCVLSGAAEDILVMSDLNDPRMRKPVKDLLRAPVADKLPFNIDVAERFSE